MAKDAAVRYATSADFRTALDGYLATCSTANPRGGDSFDATLCRRRQAWTLTAAVVAAVAVVAFVWNRSAKRDELEPIRALSNGRSGAIAARDASPAPIATTGANGPPAVVAPIPLPERDSVREPPTPREPPPVAIHDDRELPLARAVRELAADVANYLQSAADIRELAIGGFTPAQPELPSSFGIALKNQFADELEQSGVQRKRLTRYSCKGEYAFSREEEKVVIDVVLREGAARRKTYSVEIDGVADLAVLVQGRPRLHLAVLAADAYPNDLALSYPVRDAEVLSKALCALLGVVFRSGQNVPPGERRPGGGRSSRPPGSHGRGVADRCQAARFPGALRGGARRRIRRRLLFRSSASPVGRPGRSASRPRPVRADRRSVVRAYRIAPRGAVPHVGAARHGACRRGCVAARPFAARVGNSAGIAARLAVGAGRMRRQMGYALETDGDGYFARCLRDGLAGEADGLGEPVLRLFRPAMARLTWRNCCVT